MGSATAGTLRQWLGPRNLPDHLFSTRLRVSGRPWCAVGMLKRSGGRLAALGCLVLFGCARSPAKAVSEPVGVSPAATLAPAAVTSGPHSAAASTPKGPAPVEWPELVRHFAEAQVTGTVALYDTRDGVLGCSNLEKCGQAYLPASTYKIPHSMIALETGVVAGADTVFPWDKQQYQVANWNQNLTFRDAFRYSCVPCYQAIARQVGKPASKHG